MILPKFTEGERNDIIDEMFKRVSAAVTALAVMRIAGAFDVPDAKRSKVGG